MSKAVSKACQWLADFTMVAPSAYLSASRSSIGMWWTASAASRCSVSETGSPARRSSSTNPERRFSMPGASELAGREELLGRLVDVALVLEQDVEAVLGR